MTDGGYEQGLWEERNRLDNENDALREQLRVLTDDLALTREAFDELDAAHRVLTAAARAVFDAPADPLGNDEYAVRGEPLRALRGVLDDHPHAQTRDEARERALPLNPPMGRGGSV